MTILKTILSAAAGAVLAATSGTAALAETTMNLGWATPLDNVYGAFAVKFKELAEEYTDGEIEVKLRPSGQIGGEDEAFKALQLGTIDGYLISGNNVAPHFPLMDLFALPYIFQGPEHAEAVFDSDVGDYLKEELYKRTKVHLLSFNRFVYRDMYNTEHPIETLADLEGLKVRVPKNEVMLRTWRAFGAEPVPLAWSETPTALQTGTIDGGDNGTEVILSMKFYEFADYLTILETFGGSTPLFVSDRFMSKLDEEETAAVKRAAAEAEAYQRELFERATDVVRDKLVESGMAITYPDKAEFIEVAMTVQDEIAAERDEEFKDLLVRIRALAP